MNSGRAMRPGFMQAILDFLMRPSFHRGSGVAAIMALALLASACGGSGHSLDDCRGVGCALPPMCSEGCRAPCGCCTCQPGERNGDLLCTDQGCYVSAPPTDAGTDAGWTPAAACALPFDPGTCRGAIPVYASVGGACVGKIYGGCDGNDNRFNTLEECLLVCEGRPVPNGCPAGRIVKEICLECGLAGGCGKSESVCALPCDADAGAAPCGSAPLFCTDGVCQASFCI